MLESALTMRSRELARSLAERNQVVIERSAVEFDHGLLMAERESYAQGLAQDLRLLREVEAARDRLSNRTFGFCLLCDNAIAAERLAAMPLAPYCDSCQTDVEWGRALWPKLAAAA
jgi:DnaK suppressor protein